MCSDAVPASYQEGTGMSLYRRQERLRSWTAGLTGHSALKLLVSPLSAEHNFISVGSISGGNPRVVWKLDFKYHFAQI